MPNKPLRRHSNCKSQDFCQICICDELGEASIKQTKQFDLTLTSEIDFICDIVPISQLDATYNVILCAEMLEYMPKSTLMLAELARLIKPNGLLILTAPLASMVHLTPYHNIGGFSRYWYEHHLPLRAFDIKKLSPNGVWFSYFYQELMRLGSTTRRRGDRTWPLAYI